MTLHAHGPFEVTMAPQAPDNITAGTGLAPCAESGVLLS